MAVFGGATFAGGGFLIGALAVADLAPAGFAVPDRVGVDLAAPDPPPTDVRSAPFTGSPVP